MKGSLGFECRRITKALPATACLVLLLAPLGTAQNFNTDARMIALGGAGEHSNDASRLAGKSRSYRSFVLPIGLFQVLKDRKIFDPGADEFNPIRAMELLASPLHFTFNRNEGDAGEKLVRDIINGTFSRDLNAYRGFIPKSKLTAKGLMSPTWGKTFRVHGGKDNTYHGVYVGVGPYVSLGTDVTIDDNLIKLLASTANIYSPNTNFLVHNTTDGQAAASIAAGYRVRVPVPGRSFSGSDRDGVYIAANYNYLYGFHYDTADLNVRFDTDSGGLLTLAPRTTPVVASHDWSTKGRGFAVDLSSSLVVDHWDFRFAANGVGNRIEWENLRSEQFVLNSLFQGATCAANAGVPSSQVASHCFVQTKKQSLTGTRRIELPVQYIGGGAYNTDKWSTETEIAHGLQELEFRAGGEYRLRALEFRGGGRYVKKMWQPAGGVGLNVTKGFGIDLAMFGTATNIERARKAAMALSLRFGH